MKATGNHSIKSSFRRKTITAIVCAILLMIVMPGAFAIGASSNQVFTTITERSYTDTEAPQGQGSQEPSTPAATTGESSDDASSTVNKTDHYTLYLTHYFQFEADGKARTVKANQTIDLSASDFVDGKLDLNKYAYDADQLSVIEAKPLSVDDFDSDGNGGARIRYAVEDGWKMVRKEGAPGNAVSLRGVFTGTGLDDYVFVPANVVQFTLAYKYSNTGALAGMDVTGSQTVEAQAVKQSDGTYVVEWTLPTKDGFRVVMNPDPLNAYLVSPPTGNETPEENAAKLENGDYNVNVENPDMPVYYDQTNPGVETNPTYQNQYSDQYNEAWNEARVLTVEGDTGYTAEAVCGNPTGSHPSDDKHGANALVDPKVRVILNEAQMNSVKQGQSQLDTITVNYRRNATMYAVNHWVPKDLTRLSDADLQAGLANGTYAQRSHEGTDYIRLNREEIQGRVGALTKAEPLTTGPVYEILTPKTYSQEIIANNTEIDLYYEPISPVRVIFDTDYTYIPRQQVEVGDGIDFGEVNNPIRTGYTFGGWQYINKDAQPDANGRYADDDYTKIDGTVDAPQLTIDDALLSKAKVENVDGMLILHLYPQWVPAQTQVRVVFWTEDLAGGNKDVQATTAGGNPSGYADKYANYYEDKDGNEYLQTTLPNLGHNNADIYSNVGSFTFNHTTGEALTDSDGNLLPEIQQDIDTHFEDVMIEGRGTNNELKTDVFYTQNSFEVTHGAAGESKATEIAEADGKTTIYVYYTRNIYELMFHYYGHATDFYNNSLSSDYTVAINTNGFSYAPGGASAFVTGDAINFSYQNPNYINNPSANEYARNIWKVTADQINTTNPINSQAAGTVNQSAITGMDPAKMTVPQTITIRAKYGADLRDVWPVATNTEEQFTADPRSTHVGEGVKFSNGRILRMISWATTAGAYNQKARTLVADPTTRSQAEPTIMGTYGGMGSEIIADPSDPSVTHHLVAYWNDQAVNYYTNNHCFELPGLTEDAVKADSRVITTNIYDQDTENNQNRIYLVPKDTSIIKQYGFTDLMSVSWNGNTIGWDDPNGNYYAVRIFNDRGTVKCYAVARRVQTLSTAGINNQNPSARLHMTRANTVPDHNTQFDSTQSQNAYTAYGVASNDVNDPYQLYFYYNRDRYDIIYMVPSDLTGTPEYELGRNELPYGAQVTKEMYGFPLNYRDMNDNSAYNWTPTQTGGNYIPVCPDRSQNGTKAWTFIGWALGPSGSNMQWEYQGTRPSGDEFAIQGNLRVYAMWDAPSYTVTFDYAGGTEAGSELGSLSQDVSANTRYSASGVVPRPLYVGHTLLGWYIVNPDGTLSDTPFDFDAQITSDMTVRAKWEESTTQQYSYNVYYISKTLTDPSSSASYQTVTVDGEQWYVIDKDEHPDQEFVRNIDLNISAKALDGYIPIDTNERLTVSGPGSYDVYVRYTTPEYATHTVRYVKAGTEGNANPEIVWSYATSADQVVTTPGGKESKKLIHMGYELMSKQADGGYKAAMNADDLTWIDPDGNPQPMDTLSGTNIPDTITYLVRPLTYEISYLNAEGSPSAADQSLANVTAPEGTFVASAEGKNPTCYITTDSFGIKNPERVFQDGKWYRFAYWSLGDGTVLTDAARVTDKFDTLSVDPGTVGDLTFVANWVAEGDPSGGGDGGNGSGTDGSGDGSASSLPKLSDLANPLFCLGIVGVLAVVAIASYQASKRKKLIGRHARR